MNMLLHQERLVQFLEGVNFNPAHFCIVAGIYVASIYVASIYVAGIYVADRLWFFNSTCPRNLFVQAVVESVEVSPAT